MSVADFITYSLVIGAGIALIVIIWGYAKGLRKSPRDLWLMFTYKVIEYAGYAAMNLAMSLWLSRDCKLGDITAGSFISAWSITMSVMGMITGALVDTIGIRKTMFVSVFFIILGRISIIFLTHPALIFFFAFIPLGIGFAIVSPLISVVIKRYTTKEGAAIGFGLFYVLMNLGYAIGGLFFDWMRETYSTRDSAGAIVNENAGMMLFGHHFSTYQLIFLAGLIATFFSLFLALTIRDGIELNDEEEIVVQPQALRGSGITAAKNASIDTCKSLFQTAQEKFFWIYLGLISLTIFVRCVFFHFNYTFPKYGVRVLGEGAKVGSIYSMLNPGLIIFLVPLIATLTKRISSYQLMIWGTALSAASCFIAVMPASWFANLSSTVLGDLVFVRWLGMAPDMNHLLAHPPAAEYWPIIFFIALFTVGEAIWSPRLMQFTAEIAPPGKEGTYIALSVLPFFAAKFVVGPMSGWLVSTYTPLDAAGHALASYPDHHMIWIWIGGMAALSPIGLWVFRLWFHKNTAHHEPAAGAQP